MKAERRNRCFKLIAVLLILLLTVPLAACGGGSDGPGDGSGVPSGSQGGGTDTGASGAETRYVIPEFRDSVFDESAAEGNEEVLVDMSSAADGYVALICDSDKRIKFQVLKDEETYTYDVVMGKPQIFPLQSGDGHYVFKVMKNIEDSKYYELYRCEADVVIPEENAPFLRPNQYAGYAADSACVAKARELAENSATEVEFVDAVFRFVCKNVKYDYDKAENVKSGYIPDPDETMTTGMGICIDYACLTASMLRSMGIPVKIIFGYVSPGDVYHAWNMFYTEATGWTTVEFRVSPNDWTRMDTTFSANGTNARFIGDGSNYADVYQY